jgi:hypothetical protein
MTEPTADAEQAAYFRESLDAERRQRLDGILQRRPLIERRLMPAGYTGPSIAQSPKFDT